MSPSCSVEVIRPATSTREFGGPPSGADYNAKALELRKQLLASRPTPVAVPPPEVSAEEVAKRALSMTAVSQDAINAVESEPAILSSVVGNSADEALLEATLQEEDFGPASSPTSPRDREHDPYFPSGGPTMDERSPTPLSDRRLEEQLRSSGSREGGLFGVLPSYGGLEGSAPYDPFEAVPSRTLPPPLEPPKERAWRDAHRLAGMPQGLEQGSLLRVRIEPQGTLALKAGCEAIFCVNQATADTHGIRVEVGFLGAEDTKLAGQCARSLFKRGVPAESRAALHLCWTNSCQIEDAGRRPKARYPDKLLIHVRHFRIIEVRDCVDPWAAKGLQDLVVGGRQALLEASGARSRADPPRGSAPDLGRAPDRTRSLAEQAATGLGDHAARARESQQRGGEKAPDLSLDLATARSVQLEELQAADRRIQAQEEEIRSLKLAAARAVEVAAKEAKGSLDPRRSTLGRGEAHEDRRRDALEQSRLAAGYDRGKGPADGRRPERTEDARGSKGDDHVRRPDRDRPFRGDRRSGRRDEDDDDRDDRKSGRRGRDRTPTPKKEEKKKKKGGRKEKTDDEGQPRRNERSRTPRRGFNLPGFHAPLTEGDLPGRAAGVFGIAEPDLRTEDIIKAMTEAFDNANRARARRLVRMRQQEKKESKKDKKDKKKKSKKSRDSSSSSSSSSSEASGASIKKILGKDDQPFRQAAKKHPGVFFADAVAKCRQGVAQTNHELQASRSGPVFGTWFEYCYKKKVGGHLKAEYKRDCSEELELLIILLDEIVAGRFVEAADVLASRMRQLTVGLESGNWNSAEEFLVYRKPESSLVSPDAMDVAHAAAEKRQKRFNRAARVNGRAGR